MRVGHKVPHVVEEDFIAKGELARKLLRGMGWVRHVLLPSARAIFGWRVSLVAETLGASSGVGYRLKQAADLIQIDQVFAWTVVQIAMMLAIEVAVLKPIERHLFRWRRDVRA
jgi:ABC-type nitrate/sulfonate/bicarbonate transport system permease component